MSTETPSYLARPPVRRGSDFLIDSPTHAVELYPLLDGRIGVSVIGYPEGTGFDRACRFTNDEGIAPYFLPAEIHIEDGAMTCLAGNRSGAFFQAGFRVELAEGMADALRAAMIQLAPLVTELSRVRAEADCQLARYDLTVDSFNYMHDAAIKAIAAVVFDGQLGADAIAIEFERYDQHAQPFRDALIQALSAI